MVGQHAVKHWSSTQQSVTLSSGEAEFAGVIRGAGQGLGYQALLRDLGVELPLRVDRFERGDRHLYEAGSRKTTTPRQPHVMDSTGRKNQACGPP